jgi:hypothetical protein
VIVVKEEMILAEIVEMTEEVVVIEEVVEEIKGTKRKKH